MTQSKSIFWQAQEAVAKALNEDEVLSGRVPIVSENQRDIDYQVKNALGRQGIIGITMTPKATYQGVTSKGEQVWDLRDFTVQFVENPVVNRTKPNADDVVTSLDAAARTLEVLGSPMFDFWSQYCPNEIETGQDRGLLVTDATFSCQIRADRTPPPIPLSDCYAVYVDGTTRQWHVSGNQFNTGAVAKEGLVSLRIQEGIATIGNQALKDASQLSSIELPSTLTTVGENAFDGCGIISVEIPEGTYRLFDECFTECASLKTVVIPSTMEWIDNDAFYLCRAVDDVYCYADPARLDWEDPDEDDFKQDGSTRCHVKPEYLAAYQQNFREVHVTFVGDLS